jgi:hypothetical protein
MTKAVLYPGHVYDAGRDEPLCHCFNIIRSYETELAQSLHDKF